MVFDSKENLISINVNADTHLAPTPFHSKQCPSEVISSLEKLKNGLQNGVRESVKIISHNAPKTPEKISFAGVKTPEDKKKEVEQANEPGFFRKYVSIVNVFINILIHNLYISGIYSFLLFLFCLVPCLLHPNKISVFQKLEFFQI